MHAGTFHLYCQRYSQRQPELVHYLNANVINQGKWAQRRENHKSHPHHTSTSLDTSHDLQHPGCDQGPVGEVHIRWVVRTLQETEPAEMLSVQRTCLIHEQLT